MGKSCKYVFVIFLMFSVTCFAVSNSHKFNFMGKSDDEGKQYCKYCHKIRKSYNIDAFWGKSKTYTYASPTLNVKEFKKNIKSIEKITEVCLSCHPDYINHNNLHPFSVSIDTAKNVKKNIAVINKKVSDKLPLFSNNNVECATCHDPHGKKYKLLRDGLNSLCSDCHDK